MHRGHKTKASRSTRLAVHFSSATHLWETPWGLFRELDREFRFTRDVCAIRENAKCTRYFAPEDDGLAQPWTGVCWMNPPYGRTIGLWVGKAHAESRRGATVVCLLPARTDTAWFQDIVMRASEIRLVRGRLKFGTAENSAPFPSAVVVFRPGPEPETPRLLTMSVRRRGIPEFSVN